MVGNQPKTSAAESMGIFVFGCLAILFNYMTDYQKEKFRTTDGKCFIWGRQAKYLVRTAFLWCIHCFQMTLSHFRRSSTLNMTVKWRNQSWCWVGSGDWLDTWITSLRYCWHCLGVFQQLITAWFPSFTSSSWSFCWSTERSVTRKSVQPNMGKGGSDIASQCLIGSSRMLSKYTNVG